MLVNLRQDVVGVCLWLALSSVALGQSFAQGNARYQRGDFQGASKALVATLKTETAKDERAKAYKLLGICKFMLADKKAAAESFRQAAKLKPGLSIATNEVLDDAVIAFFNAETKSAGTAPKKGTFLRVTTNAPSSTVLMDGIIAGPAGEVINVDPGTIEIEVTATGFLSQKVKVNVVKDRENAVSVTLQKPKPKAPVVVEKKKPRLKKAKKEEDLFAPKPSEDFYAEQRDPAAEFERETQGVQQPAPQGAQLAYTQNGQPVYAIIVPQNGGVYAPPPPPAPPAAEAYAPPPANDPAYEAEPVTRDVAKEPSKSNHNLLITLLPLGAGQYQNGSYLLGTAFLATESYALYYYFTTQTKLTKTTKERNQFVSDKKAAGEGLTDTEQNYVNTTDEYISSTKQKVQYAQLGFVGLWSVGVVQALVTERDAPQAAKEKKARKQRKYGGFSYVVPDEVDVLPAVASGAYDSHFELNLKWEF